MLAPTRRYHLTAAGLRSLADDEGMTVDELLRGRPVSAQWRRILMERLDALAVHLPAGLPPSPTWPSPSASAGTGPCPWTPP